MDKKEIEKIVDRSFNAAFSNWSNQIEKELYPAAFANEYSWIRVKDSIELNNQLLKESLKLTLIEIFKNM